MSQNIDANDLLRFQLRKRITYLYKSFLVLVEDLEHDNQSSFSKLKDSIPGNDVYIDQAQVLDKGRLNYLRKKILDSGNEVIRELCTELENYSVNFSDNSYNKK